MNKKYLIIGALAVVVLGVAIFTGGSSTKKGSMFAIQEAVNMEGVENMPATQEGAAAYEESDANPESPGEKASIKVYPTRSPDPKNLQVVAGSKEVFFSRYRLTSKNGKARIVAIHIKNLGKSAYFSSIRIFNGNEVFGGVEKEAQSLNNNGEAVIDYKDSFQVINPGQSLELKIVANTIYNADAGTIGNLIIEEIEVEIDDENTRLEAEEVEQHVHHLYPTKLIFEWKEPKIKSLATGGQIEIARFTIAVAAADANNPTSSFQLESLDFQNFGSALFENFKLIDVTNNQDVANGGLTPSFIFYESKPVFEQGETRIFKILADVSTYEGSQTAQLGLRSGSPEVNGSVLWKIFERGRFTSDVRWVDLGGQTLIKSTELTAAPVASNPQKPLNRCAWINGNDAIQEPVGYCESTNGCMWNYDAGQCVEQ